MVDLGTDYWTGMDKKPMEKIDLSTKDIGISMGIGDPWVQLKSAITAGASHVELGFMGMGKGSISQPTGVTPGSIGKEKREDIRQLAKINNVTLSTHASANVMGFSGLDRNRFTDEKAAEAMSEIKRAVDFAAETAEGVPIVVHTAEFPWAISESEPEKFEAYKGEADKAMWGLVDKRTGEIKVTLTKDFKIPIAETEKVDGMEVPVVDANGEYVYKEWGYKDFIDQAKKEGIDPEKLFYKEFMEKERLRASAEEKRWALEAKKVGERFSLVKNMIDSVKELEKKNKEGADYAAMRYAEELGAAPPKQDPDRYKDFLNNPQKYLEDAQNHMKKEMKLAYENSTSAGRKRHEVEMEIGNKAKGMEGNIETLKEHALKRSAANIARLGMYALDVEKQKKLKKSLFIAPENVFPEHYGSHPQELKELITKAREEMTHMLMEKKKMSNESAKKIAEEHIKATFDIGHANTWKKYFRGDEKEFKKWFGEQVKDLIKHNIIGHVHMADNFGYADEHLTPGQGNVPVEEFIRELKASGYKDKLIVEPGSQGEGESIYSSMLGAWAKVAGSPMYKIGNISKSWTDVEGSYFGRTSSPSYMAGGYLVNPQAEENWWSGVPIE